MLSETDEVGLERPPDVTEHRVEGGVVLDRFHRRPLQRRPVEHLGQPAGFFGSAAFAWTDSGSVFRGSRRVGVIKS